MIKPHKIIIYKIYDETFNYNNFQLIEGLKQEKK